MALELYNTLTRQKEPFETLEEGVVRMYNCGPTVYARPHIGNLRSFVFADVLRRWLEYRDFEVRQVMNITDVGHLVDDADEGEDKLEAQAQREKLDPWEISARIAEQFLADLKELGFREAMAYPKATDHIPQMLEIVTALVKTGHAYRVDGDVYFDVTKFDAYGKLSGNRIEDLEAGARIAVNDDKRNPADFALWKSDSAHLMKWASEFGEHGFPGWHIECSAMAREHLGDQIDIHTGGEDNVFPHHECEIAQSESFTGKRFSRFWLHAKFLSVDGGKMGKSLGNAYDLDEVKARGYEARHLRFALLRGHYRSPLNFTWQVMDEARAFTENMDRLVQDLERLKDGVDAGVDTVAGVRREFEAAMDDDLSVPRALAAIGGLRAAVIENSIAGAGAAAGLDLMAGFDSIFGILNTEVAGVDSSVDERIAARNAARDAKDWAESDRIRDELLAEGISLEDGPGGTIWRRV